MPRFPTQTSSQALDLYKSALENSDLDLSTTFSGNIRIATKFDRAVNSITDHFRISSIEQRREQAKQIIRQKFDSEMKILGNHLSTGQRKFMDSALNLIIDGGDINQIQQNDTRESRVRVSEFNSALKHIREIGTGCSREGDRIAWQATQEFVANGKRSPDADFARLVSALTILWKKNLGLSDRAAYRLAFNVTSLNKKYGIDIQTALVILQLSGELHTRHGIKRNKALQLAIDLYIPLKKLEIGIDKISRLRQALLSKLPKLKDVDPITQISAAVCYAQLKKENYDDANAYAQIQDRLNRIPVMQNIMPKGCEVNQIHQGSHVRGYSEVDEGGLKEFIAKVTTLVEYPSFAQSEIQTKLSDDYKYFEHQFVKDLVRGFKYELRQNGVPDTEFMRLEYKRRNAMKSRNKTTKMSADDYAQWANHYQRHAGSLVAAESSSRLQTQTLLAEVEVITANHSANEANYKVKVYSDGDSHETIFSSDRRIEKNETIVNFDATQKIKAVVLLADPIVSDETDFKIVQMQLGLLENDEWLPEMEYSNPTVIRECQLTVDTKTLDAGSTTCVAKKISETWDLIPDWNGWMSKSSPML